MPTVEVKLTDVLPKFMTVSDWLMGVAIINFEKHYFLRYYC